MTDRPTHPDEQRQRDFTRLWLQSQHVLGGFVRLQIKDHNDASDIIQEVAAQASIHFEKYDPSRPFAAWLMGIARQRIAERFRKLNRSPITFSSEAVDLMMPALTAIQEQSTDRMEALRGCMARLSDKQTRLIDLRYSQMLSSDQIADAIGSTPSAINVMLFRIRDALRRCIEHKMETEA